MTSGVESANIPGAAENAPDQSAAPKSRGRFRGVARVFMAAFTWAPMVLCLTAVGVFTALFLMTSIPRLWVPFNLEWMENHMARQALRLAQGQPLYPADPNVWVPYMYTPIYNALLGAIFRLTGDYELGFGRLISLISTFVMVFGVIAIVREQTRQWLPGILCGFLYFAFFKPTGSWYDLVRSDSMALGLFVWGAFFTLKRNQTTLSILCGVLLLGLATLTKQSVGAAGVLCILWPLLTQLKKSRLPILLTSIFFLNAVLLFQNMGNEKFLDYTLMRPLKHQDASNVLWPGWKDPKAFKSELKNPGSKLEVAKEYVRQCVIDRPSWVWSDFLRHVWMFAGLMLLWPLFAFVRLKIPPGFRYILPSLALIWGGVVGLAKAGGFSNNLMPCFVGVCILTGLAIAEIRAAFPRYLMFIPNWAVAFVFLAQIFPPWHLPPGHALKELPRHETSFLSRVVRGSINATQPAQVQPGQPVSPQGYEAVYSQTVTKRLNELNQRMYVTRDRTYRALPDTEKSREFKEDQSWLDEIATGRANPGRKTKPGEKKPAVFKKVLSSRDYARAWGLYQINRLAETGLPWRPSEKQTSKDSRQAYDWLMAWLKMKREQGETVWLAHNQWYGTLTGHPTGVDIDMVRAGIYAGVTVPDRLLQPLANAAYDWILLDSPQLTTEYVVNGQMTEYISKNYDPIGPLPVYARLEPHAMTPVTGVAAKPYMLYRAKRFKGEVGDPFARKPAKADVASEANAAEESETAPEPGSADPGADPGADPEADGGAAEPGSVN